MSELGRTPRSPVIRYGDDVIQASTPAPLRSPNLTLSGSPDPADIDKTDVPINIMPIQTDGTFTRQGFQLPFVAKSVRISNPTGQWWWLSFAQTWIPPFYMFLILNLPEGPSAVEVIPETPVGCNSPGPTGAVMTMTFFDRLQPPSPGQCFGQTTVAKAITA